MTRPGLVLIHGGQHTHRCWQPTVDVLARTDPDLRVLAVDLPGRESEPGDLATLTIGQCVQSVVDQIERAGLDRVVLVGHSMAGITLPGVATALGAPRVQRMVMVTCCVPAQGTAIVDTIAGPLRLIVRRAIRRVKAQPALPRWLAGALFCNGMTKVQKKLVYAQLCADSPSVAAEKVDRSALPPGIPRTWVLALRDRSLKPHQQRAFIDNLGQVTDIVEVDGCHDVMVSHPEEVARILAERCSWVD